MRRMIPAWTLAVVVPAWLLALPAAAQERDRGANGPATHRGEARGGGGGGSAPAGGGTTTAGGGTSTASPGSGSSPAGWGGSSGSGGGRVNGGGRHAATGGQGVAVPRGEGASPRDGGGRRERSDGNSGAASGGSTAAPVSGQSGRAVGRADGGPRDRAVDGGASGVPPHARPRSGDEPIVGRAVPRGSVPPRSTGVGTVVAGSYFPWWIGTGYYGGYGYGYGGYYGGYYDPWFGAYPGYYDPYDVQPVYSDQYFDEGSLRLKIKPRNAEVYVDGYYVGIVDDFDGIFQRLHIESGAHRVEVRAPGFETLTFEVRISPDHSTTYTGELQRIQ